MRSTLEVVLEFLGRPLVWLTIVVGIALWLGLANVAEIERLLKAVGQALNNATTF